MRPVATQKRASNAHKPSKAAPTKRTRAASEAREATLAIDRLEMARQYASDNAERRKRLAPLSAEECARVDDMRALMRAALNWEDAQSNYPVDPWPEYQQHQKRLDDFQRTLLELDRHAGALYNFLRSDLDGRRRPARLEPGAFARLVRLPFVASFDELTCTAVIWCEKYFKGDAPLDHFAGSLRALIEHGHVKPGKTVAAAPTPSHRYAYRGLRLFGLTAAQRGEGKWLKYVAEKMPRPLRRGPLRGRKSAIETVATFIDCDCKMIKQAVERAERDSVAMALRKKFGARFEGLSSEKRAELPLSVQNIGGRSRR